MSKGRKFYYRSWQLPLEEGVAAAQMVLGIWKRWRGDGLLPARRALDPIELRPFLGLLYLLEVTREPFDLICRLDGSTIALASYEDQTNRSLRDGSPAPTYERIFADVAQAAETREPVLWLVDHGHDGHGFRYQRLILPFGSHARPEWLLVYNHSLEHPQGRFPEIR